MLTLHRAHRRAKTFYVVSGLGLVGLLSACGGQPEANNAAELPIENAANVASEVAVNEAATVANEAVAPAPANTAEAPAAKVDNKVEKKPETAAAEPEKKAVAAATPAGDAANGAKLFAQCKICHSVEPGKNGLGPSLHNVVGRKAAVEAGYAYSPAMKNSGITWTDAEISEYLRAPMKLVPGTKMAFAGMANEKDRADVIAYLDTLK
ncbi:MAG TPA: cytochrome c family protein [Sphingobium sp.]|nr:cytochrome c family protein [Sphingobium sp.]